jgi:molybdate transport system substrate-binding protein
VSLPLRLFALIVLLVAGCKASPSEDVVRVAAAANLRDAFEELGTLYESTHKSRVSFSFGSSGILAQQIQQGAPFDVFAAANRDYAEEVAKTLVCDASTMASYGQGRLVLWSKTGITDLNDPRIQKLAIANPDHAPYGRAARETLKSSGLWEQIQPRLVFAENIRQTLQFAETGNADAAIVALSLVIHDKTHAWTLIKEDTHKPLDQALIVCNGGTNRTKGQEFALFVNSPPGREIMRRYGFLLPGERTIQTP